MRGILLAGFLGLGAGLLPGEPDSPSSGAAAQLPAFDPFLQKQRGLTRENFFARYGPRPSAPDGLGIDLETVKYLDLIQKRLKPRIEGDRLADPELKALSSQGLVILNTRSFPSFGDALYDVFANDHPLFITSDSLLHAFHKSFDGLLMDLELGHLKPCLTAILESGAAGVGGIRDSLGSDALVMQGCEDVQFLLETARTLLVGATSHPDPRVDQILKAVASETTLDVRFMGRPRKIDFSQFRPRGHYTKSEELKRYFRAMMWLGREDLAFQIGESFRETVAGFLMADALQRGGALPRWTEFDRMISFLVGAPDGAGPMDLLTLLGRLGYADFADFVRRARPAETLVRIGAEKIGRQKIMSAICLKEPGEAAFQLPKTAQLMGQRFTLDSFMFHQLTFDRTSGPVARMLPQPLDIPAAMGQSRAVELLKPDLDQHRHQENLAACIDFVRAAPEAFWQETVYHGWLDALRELGSPPGERGPPLLRTRAWADLKLQTQLASWAQLRHDTILYAKQSYSMGITCEYCDVYVEPVPGFLAKLGALCRRTVELLREPPGASKELKLLLSRYQAHFVQFAATLERLKSVAEKELQGAPIDAEEHRFLREVVEIKTKSVGCGTVQYFLSGWYPKLFVTPMESLEWDPTIADIHTQPTDEQGALVGRVLHVGVGNVNLAAFLVRGHDGVTRAFLGPVFSYFEVVEANFNRLTDEKWRERVGNPGSRLGKPQRVSAPTGPAPERPSWVKGLLGR